jgi:hypothetical protein
MPGNGKKANCGNFPMGFAANGQMAERTLNLEMSNSFSIYTRLSAPYMGKSRVEMMGSTGHSCPFSAMVAVDHRLALLPLLEAQDGLAVPTVK